VANLNEAPTASHEENTASCARTKENVEERMSEPINKLDASDEEWKVDDRHMMPEQSADTNDAWVKTL
jgi:hypothetical protein